MHEKVQIKMKVWFSGRKRANQQQQQQKKI